MDGEYTIFPPKGQAKQTFAYQKGVLNGPAKTFFGSGLLEHDFSHCNSEVDDTYLTFSAEGKLPTECSVKAGQLQ